MMPQRGTSARPSAARMVENVVGCKWSLSVLSALRKGVLRPGALERECTGISTKVLNQRLSKLVRFGVLERREFEETPPRVEYHFTPFGVRFLAIVDEVEALQRELGEAGSAGADS